MALDISTPCPDKPNCVSSLSVVRDDQQMKALSYTGTLEQAQKKLKEVLSKEASCELVEIDKLNWHCVFTSSFMKYKDDVFFRFDDQQKQIDFRSSSRKGYYDFGANRKRMNKISQALQRSNIEPKA